MSDNPPDVQTVFTQGHFVNVGGNQYTFSSNLAAIAATQMLLAQQDPDQPSNECGYFNDNDSAMLAQIYLDMNDDNE
jgi:hypothetical protein